MSKFVFELGAAAKDTITGFAGIITGRTEWMNGCIRYELTSKGLDKEGKAIVEHWFDEQRLVLVADAAAKPTTKGPGGPQRDPVSSRDPVL